MKNLGTILSAVFLAIILILYMCTFQVRFTEVAIKKTWGQPDKAAITEPGLKFKWPAPIQSVVVYDKRMRILEDRTEETRTVDGKNLLITTFTLWRIKDPSTFHTNFPGGVEDGEIAMKILDAILNRNRNLSMGGTRDGVFGSRRADRVGRRNGGEPNHGHVSSEDAG